MTAGMINILDERVNGHETRLLDLEKITKEIHSAVLKYKNKTYENVLTDKMATL